MDILDTGYSMLDLSISDFRLSNADCKSKIENRKSKINDRESREQVAKDFESVLINKLLDEMKNTIGDWGFDEDGLSKGTPLCGNPEVQGIFWLYLAQDIANQGGLGLWKDIYEFLTNNKSA